MTMIKSQKHEDPYIFRLVLPPECKLPLKQLAANNFRTINDEIVDTVVKHIQKMYPTFKVESLFVPEIYKPPKK